MKIAIVCDVLGEENNGTTIAAMNLIRTLSAKGHELRVVCPDPGRAGAEGFYVVPQLSLGPLNAYIKKNNVTIARLDRGVLEAALHDADVIHVMMPFALGKAAAVYAHAHGISLTAGFHCQAENVTGHIFLKDLSLASRAAYRIFYRRLYRYCDCVHYPTQFICDTFEAVVGATPHRVISNGVGSAFIPRPVARSTSLQDRYIVLFTGRYSPEKSHDVLIDAVARSRHKNEIQLIFAGSGPRKEALVRRALKRDIPLPLMRFYNREELIDVINSADLYVHPAEIEIESIACLEAIACGRVPLIADSPRSATRYFAMTERNLFRYNDPADLAEKMDWWLERPEERERCAASYLGYAKQFDFDRCMDEMERMLLDAAEEKRHAG